MLWNFVLWSLFRFLIFLIHFWILSFFVQYFPDPILSALFLIFDYFSFAICLTDLFSVTFPLRSTSAIDISVPRFQLPFVSLSQLVRFFSSPFCFSVSRSIFLMFSAPNHCLSIFISQSSKFWNFIALLQ